MSVSRGNVFLARKSLRIMRAKIVMVSLSGQIFLEECLPSAVPTQTMSGDYFLLFCPYVPLTEVVKGRTMCVIPGSVENIQSCTANAVNLLVLK